jgi:hypothetical protein
MKKIFLSVCFAVAVLSLQAQPPKVPAPAGATFGEKVTAEHAISPEQLVTLVQSKPDKKADVKLKATVNQVCKMEGCWIKVKSPDGSMMVRMKDHKFTVPLVLDGKTIVIEGTAEEKLTTVEQLRHFAEDAGKSKEEIAKIKEPKKEIVMQAKGILVL